MDQDPHYRTMFMPRLSRWYGLVTAVAILGAMSFAVWRADAFWWYLPLPVAIFIAGFGWLRMYHFVRCPRCSQHLKPRKVEEIFRPAGTKRFLYDCHACQITWDSQCVEEPMSDT
jgi:hypothetical protein